MTGKNHDRSSLALTPLLAIPTSLYLPLHLVAIAIMGFSVGWLWLSPDMDCNSNPTNRWGVLKPLWKPYRKSHRHRGRSHWPLWGSAERLLYIALILFPIFVAALWLSGASPAQLGTWMQQNQAIPLAAYGGIEVACLWHLCCDYVWPLNRL